MLPANDACDNRVSESANPAHPFWVQYPSPPFRSFPFSSPFIRFLVLSPLRQEAVAK